MFCPTDPPLVTERDVTVTGMNVEEVAAGTGIGKGIGRLIDIGTETGSEGGIVTQTVIESDVVTERIADIATENMTARNETETEEESAPMMQKTPKKTVQRGRKSMAIVLAAGIQTVEGAPDLETPGTNSMTALATVTTGGHMDDEVPQVRRLKKFRRASPKYEAPPAEDYNPDEPKEDDSEARSVFVSQLAARMTARDLGYFFEDKLGEGTVMDSRIVTDRISRRSKGIGYVEFKTIEFVEKAIALTGTVVMGLPIMVQLTESERNRLHPGDGNLNLPPGVSATGGAMQLYVGSLHFNLTENDIRQVFEPFGPLEYVDLHRDPMTGRSKGYAFVQYKRGEHAKMALEQMEGFELAGRALRVNTVHEKGTARYTQQDSLEDSGGGNLNAASRQALMHKLARIETPPALPDPVKPNIPAQAMQSRSVLLKNMFDPEEETERDWDKDLAEDVKGECEEKYGKVEAIKVEKETQGEIYVKFDTVETAKKAVQGLNGRWFGGKQVTATFISDAIMQAHQ
ncbi:Phosphatidylinositol-3-phosphatase SAC1 [Marasmius crinis-equi]|uniref:Phosphatidylinositol-3-phosphatase SAC1 n=1 Tax=Marasmius crinis-equi TaxID=585013 RepID=A0ABR3FLT8_9AGAR